MGGHSALEEARFHHIQIAEKCQTESLLADSSHAHTSERTFLRGQDILYNIPFNSLEMSQAQKLHIGEFQSRAKDDYNILTSI